MSITDKYFLIAIVMAALCFVARDWWVIEIRKKPIGKIVHRKTWLLRAIIGIGLAFFFSDGKLEIIENIIAAPFIVWPIFQYGLNIARGKEWYHMNPEDSWWDAKLLWALRGPLPILMFMVIMFASCVWMKIAGIQCMVYGCY